MEPQSSGFLAARVTIDRLAGSRVVIGKEILPLKTIWSEPLLRSPIYARKRLGAVKVRYGGNRTLEHLAAWVACIGGDGAGNRHTHHINAVHRACILEWVCPVNRLINSNYPLNQPCGRVAVDRDRSTEAW